MIPTEYLGTVKKNAAHLFDRLSSEGDKRQVFGSGYLLQNLSWEKEPDF